MRRFHLLEFEDQPWFPDFIRNYMTDFLQFVANQFDFYREQVPLIKKGLEKSGGTTIIDLASGGGGGWKRLSKHLKEEVPNLKIVLTDYFPNKDAFEDTQKNDAEIFKYETQSVNAMDVPKHLKGLRSQFLSFHHFKPADAKQILQNAVDDKAPIIIIEAQERNIPHLIKFFFSPINVALVTPFIRPLNLGRFIFTYLIPVVPAFVFWDGLVSVLRTYSPEEIRTMTEELENGDQFDWEIGKTTHRHVTIIYALGYPK